ncbi:MAG: TldD/PmbA family protein [Candidatus Thorarchaeota archaeon]
MDSNKNVLMEKASIVIKESENLGASQIQVSMTLADTALTRLANSIIDQNVADRRSVVSIYLYYGKKQGSVRFEVFEDDALIEATQVAAKLAKVSPISDDIVSLPEPHPYSKAFDESDLIALSSINATPEQRAEFAMNAVAIAHDTDPRIKSVAGAISHAVSENVLVNNLGVEAYEKATRSNINLTVLAEDGSEETAGWCEDRRRGFGDLMVKEVAEIAAQKAADGFGMKYIDPGDYEVVLEPAAMGDFMFFLSFFGFSARAYQDYRSFLRDRIGEKMFSEKFTLLDDATDIRFVDATKYDSEGYPKSRIELVNAGVVKNIVYDSKTAAVDGVKSTGHNARSMGRSLPIANHMILEDGDSSVEEMIAETGNGILVTHFHYQNAVDPTQGTFTGLTRDGAWYIKNGEIQYPLKTLRYTDAAPRFLGDIDLIGKYTEINTSDAIVPPVKLPSFRITGSSKE